MSKLLTRKIIKKRIRTTPDEIVAKIKAERGDGTEKIL